jgi:hypothetical protein
MPRFPSLALGLALLVSLAACAQPEPVEIVTGPILEATIIGSRPVTIPQTPPANPINMSETVLGPIPVAPLHVTEWTLRFDSGRPDVSIIDTNPQHYIGRKVQVVMPLNDPPFFFPEH